MTEGSLNNRLCFPQGATTPGRRAYTRSAQWRAVWRVIMAERRSADFGFLDVWTVDPPP